MTTGKMRARGRMKRLAAFLMALVFAVSVTLVSPLTTKDTYAAASGVYTKLTGLKSKFPENKYWNHKVTSKTNDGDSLMARRDESFANSVTSSQCHTHNGKAGIGQYDCNYFDGGMQCMGFAKKVFYDVFGQRESSLAARHDTQNLQVGDYVRINNNGHSGVVLSISGNSFRLVECNFNGMGRCLIKWGYVNYNKSCITYFKHATNYDTINRANVNVQMSWTNCHGSFAADNAVIYVTPKANISGQFTAASATVYNARGQYVASRSERASHSGSYMNIWYNIRSEMGKTLASGSLYYIRFSTTFAGKTYTSPLYSFRTTTVAVSRVSLNTVNVRVKRGAYYQLRGSVAPANATSKTISWKSSNTKIATVTAAGRIRAVKKGSCYITASCGGKSIRCKVTVV